MSKKKHTPLPGLIDEYPILVYPKLAAAIGINEAIICQQLHYLLSSVEEVDKTFNYVNDRWWVYHTLEEWHDKYFCWIAIGTVGRLLRKLEDKGLILSMQSVKNPSDRTKWYTIDHDQWIEIISPIVTNCNYQPSLQNVTINTTNCKDGYNKTLVKEKKKEKDSLAQNASGKPASDLEIGHDDDEIIGDIILHCPDCDNSWSVSKWLEFNDCPTCSRYSYFNGRLSPLERLCLSKMPFESNGEMNDSFGGTTSHMAMAALCHIEDGFWVVSEDGKRAMADLEIGQDDMVALLIRLDESTEPFAANFEALLDNGWVIIEADNSGNDCIVITDNGRAILQQAHDEPILMTAVVATLRNIIAYVDNPNYAFRHNPRAWARCEKHGLIVNGSVTAKGFELIAQYDNSHEAIALRIRAENEATMSELDLQSQILVPAKQGASDWTRDAVGNGNADAMQVQLTAEQAAVLDYINSGDDGLTPYIPTDCQYAEDNQVQINEMVEMGYLDSLDKLHRNNLMYWRITDKGRAALEAHNEPPTPPETPATSTGSPPEDLEAQQDTIPTKPVKPLKTAKAKKPGKSPEQKQIEANMWEAVKFVWKLTDNAAWKITKFRKFFLGTVKNSKADKRYGDDWKNCQLAEHPATPQEVVAFGHWYRNTYDDITLPEKGSTLLNHFEGFRGHESYNAFIRKAANTILDKLPKFSSPGIDLEREQNKPVDEAEIVVMTPEQKAEIKAMYDSIGKGGK